MPDGSTTQHELIDALTVIAPLAQQLDITARQPAAARSGTFGSHEARDRHREATHGGRMTIPTETLNRILIEVVLGKPPARQDTDEEGTARRQLSEEVAAIREAGGIVEIPPDIP